MRTNDYAVKRDPYWENFTCGVKYNSATMGSVNYTNSWVYNSCGYKLLDQIKGTSHEGIRDKLNPVLCSAWFKQYATI